jgi:hypothetical protein
MAFAVSEIVRRIKVLLPDRWFGDNTPVLDAILAGMAVGLSNLFGFIDYARSATRLQSAPDFWLDLIARDFLGTRTERRPRESDDSFRVRIAKELIRDRCTRPAMEALLTDLTGRSPIIFEPTNPGDTGCYSSPALTAAGNICYGFSGGWGSLTMPFQSFVKVFRQLPEVSTITNGWGEAVGAYGSGMESYMSGRVNPSIVTDAEIYRDIWRNSAAGSVIWVLIQP